MVILFIYNTVYSLVSVCIPFLLYVIDYVFQLSQCLPLCPLPPSTPSLLPSIPPLSSCPWVVHISSLASSFPILFLTSHLPVCSVSTKLYFLIPAPFPPFSPFPLTPDNPPNDLHTYDSISVLLFWLVCFLDSIVDSCEFIAILMFIVWSSVS